MGLQNSKHVQPRRGVSLKDNRDKFLSRSRYMTQDVEDSSSSSDGSEDSETERAPVDDDSPVEPTTPPSHKVVNPLSEEVGQRMVKNLQEKKTKKIMIEKTKEYPGVRRRNSLPGGQTNLDTIMQLSFIPKTELKKTRLKPINASKKDLPIERVTINVEPPPPHEEESTDSSTSSQSKKRSLKEEKAKKLEEKLHEKMHNDQMASITKKWTPEELKKMLGKKKPSLVDSIKADLEEYK